MRSDHRDPRRQGFSGCRPAPKSASDSVTSSRTTPIDSGDDDTGGAETARSASAGAASVASASMTSFASRSRQLVSRPGSAGA